MRAPILVASDVHLSPADPAGAERFLRFLRGPAAAAATLLVAGDLFEFWVTPSQAREPLATTVIGALADLVRSGTDVGFVEGNRDFAASPELREAGVRILPDIVVAEADGLRAVVTHGDLLCRRDVRYQAFRRVVRTSFVRHMLRAAPPALARRSGSAARAGSRMETARKSEGDMGLDPRAVAALLASRDADALVCGHVHWGRRHVVRVGGTDRAVVVLGAWDSGDASFARIGGGGVTFERFEG